MESSDNLGSVDDDNDDDLFSSKTASNEKKVWSNANIFVSPDQGTLVSFLEEAMILNICCSDRDRLLYILFVY